jgi:hypothetical protein
MHAEARNQWQPVTDVYQQIIDPVAVSQLDGDPTLLIQETRRKREMAEAKVPVGITAITGLFFVRAAIYALFAAKLVASPDSDLTSWITAHCPALIPITFGSPDPKTLPTTMAEALGVMAVLSLGIGLLWLIRWLPILFISVAFAGYFLLHIGLSFFNLAPLGDPNLFGSGQIDLVVVEGALSLLTFFFICLYPNLKSSFQRKF